MRRTSASLVVAALLLATYVGAQDQQKPVSEKPTDQQPAGTPAADNKPAGKKPADEQPAPKNSGPSVWMKVKLKSTENILRGLTLGDFDLIEENARRMNHFGRLERLVHSRDAEYQTQLKFLTHANNELVRQAQKKNLDGATLAFVHLTSSCINCHRTIRDGEQVVKPSKPVWTHTVCKQTEFYRSGPQQGRPADGQLKKGTNVMLIKEAGSYCQVRTAAHEDVYVACDALQTIKK